MERSDRPSFVDWLMGSKQELQDLIGEAENAQWHHLPPGTVEREHYDRLVQLEARLDYKIQISPKNVAAEQSPTKADYVAQVSTGRRLPSSRGGECDGSESTGADGGQPGPDDHEDSR